MSMKSQSLWNDVDVCKETSIGSNIFIYNEDCEKTIDRLIDEKKTVDVILTSPPYGTSRRGCSENDRNRCTVRYDVYTECENTQQYCDWVVGLFNKFNNILSSNGVILWNVSYGTEDIGGVNEIEWCCVADIIRKTNFTVADRIVWKKKSALPNNSSTNKLTRVVEDVFVFCRKSEFGTFYANKSLTGVSKTGQQYYEVLYNYIEARNNDGSCILNKATYSTELCTKLLNMYAKSGMTIYDPFMGTGTTANACRQLSMNCIGSELSKPQCEYAKERLELNWIDGVTLSDV